MSDQCAPEDIREACLTVSKGWLVLLKKWYWMHSEQMKKLQTVDRGRGGEPESRVWPWRGRVGWGGGGGEGGGRGGGEGSFSVQWLWQKVFLQSNVELQEEEGGGDRLCQEAPEFKCILCEAHGGWHCGHCQVRKATRQMKITSQLSLSRPDAQIPLQCRPACTVVHFLLILVEKGRLGGKQESRVWPWSCEWRAAPLSFEHREVVIFYSPLAANTVGKPFISSASLPSFLKYHLLLLTGT